MVKERSKSSVNPAQAQAGLDESLEPMGDLVAGEIPPFSHVKGDMDKATAIANWVIHEIKDENWDADEYARNFAQRTPQEILTSRTRGFVGACLEDTLAANALFMNEGFKTTIVTEEVVSESLGRTRLHFALEFKTEDGVCHLDFSSPKETYLLKGPFTGVKKAGDVSLSLRRVDGDTVGLDTKPFEGMFGITDLRQLGGTFPNYTEMEFRADIEGIRADRERITAAFETHQGYEFNLITKLP